MNRGLMFFTGMFLVLLAFTPGSLRIMGYMAQDLAATDQLVAAAGDVLTLQRVERPQQWSRHGVASLISHVPFVAMGRILSNGDPVKRDRIEGLEPILETALLLTILFVWAGRLAPGGRWSFFVALAAGFTTLLWPYAYIGLETAISLFLLLAAWLAFEEDSPRTWTRTMVFALSCALTLTAKSTGAFLIPAVAYLVYQFFERDPRKGAGPRSGKILAAAILPIAFFAANALSWRLFWNPRGGARPELSFWVVRDPIVWAMNFISFFGSANKGLFVYAPVALLALALVPAAYRKDRSLVIFALLTLASLAGAFSLFRFWADETWGPRYLHTAVAPLLLCLAAARPAARGLRRAVTGVAAALAAAGLFVSFLGVLFYYGNLHAVCTATSEITLETLQGDPVWNPVRFHAKLARILVQTRIHPDAQIPAWVPSHTWYYAPPAYPPRYKYINLRPYTVPQPLMLRRGHAAYFLFLIPGIVFLTLAGRGAGNRPPAEPGPGPE